MSNQASTLRTLANRLEAIEDDISEESKVDVQAKLDALSEAVEEAEEASEGEPVNGDDDDEDDDE